jgi:hypothetical protein
MRAAISPPMPPVTLSSWTMSARPVLLDGGDDGVVVHRHDAAAGRARSHSMPCSSESFRAARAGTSGPWCRS